jgi:hypothetical protein
MDEINEYLTSIGFTKNDRGFLSHTVQGVDYILLHDFLAGYSLQYSYVKSRTAGFDMIPLGKQPSLENVQDAFKKILS